MGVGGDVFPFANEVFPVGVCGFGDGTKEEAGSFTDYYMRGEGRREDLEDGGVSEGGNGNCREVERGRVRERFVRLIAAVVILVAE